MFSPAQEQVQGHVVGSELSSLLSSMQARVAVLHSQTGVWISAASSAQQWQTGSNSMSGLLCLQVTQHIGTRDRVTPKPLCALVPGLYLLTYKKKVTK